MDKKTFESGLTKIVTTSFELSSTINDFKDFYQPKEERSKTSSKELSEDALVLCKGCFQEHGIKLITSYEEEASISTWKNELVSVITNILLNAKEALSASNVQEKWISIRTFQEGQNSVIEINDNAGGIMLDDVSKVFEPYFSTKEEKNATGLGLYMAKMIIEEHCKGSLSVRNNEHGALFKIVL